METGPSPSDARNLAARIERHAGALEEGRRSPLTITLMRGAAGDVRRGGVVSEVFRDGPGPRGSVPALRLVGALHLLVLEGCAPDLERFYPTVGGNDPPDAVWPVAAEAVAANLDRMIELARRPVQTNEPGRSVVLYGALLRLTERYGGAVRLLEIGASAGLNLHPDRFRYRVGGDELGDPSSPLEFEEPWTNQAVHDPASIAAKLTISQRRGCDPSPIDVRSENGARALMSYLWADEPHRVANMKAAIAVAHAHDVKVEAASASEWLERSLTDDFEGLTVIWQSVVWQYLSEHERELVESTIAATGGALLNSSIAWVRMEPTGDHMHGFSVHCRTWPDGRESRIATSGNHGPPVTWD